MTTSEFAAESLVRAYLGGRTMPAIMHSAVVWMAQKRLVGGKMPVLDETLRSDIDNQAIAPPGYIRPVAAACDQPITYALLPAARWTSVKARAAMGN